VIVVERSDRANTVEVVRGSLPLFLSSLVALVAQLDVIWLAISVDATQVGLYRAVSQLQVAAGLPAQVTASVALPILVSNQRSGSGNLQRRRFFALFVVGGLLAASALAIGMPYLLELLFGRAYVAAAPAGIPLAI